MQFVISPAKTLDFETPAHLESFTTPRFLQDSQVLITELRKLSPQDISGFMKISDKLGALNYDRFHNWTTPFTPENAKQAVLAFKGDVYTGLAAETLHEKDLAWAQKHLVILSGLYGLLRPLDLIKAYRLEMGKNFVNNRGKNLYEFWGDQITEQLNLEFKNKKNPVLINLASNEYFKSIKTKKLNAEVITPIFKDCKNGRYKIISFYAKKARGLMSTYIITNRLEDPEAIKHFDTDGYYFCSEQSAENDWVFLRNER
jgi:cytoplasmic iron level regulating protein YaaA (DUF328/UPF0246 family)